MSGASLETHLTYLRNRIVTTVRQMIPHITAPEVSLVVQTGLQADMHADITVQQAMIGSALDCDIVMLDEGVEERHATLDLQRTVFGDIVAVTALAEGVSYGGSERSVGAQSEFRRLPQSLVVGPVTLELSHEARPAPAPHNLSFKPLLFVAVLAVGIAVPAFFVSQVKPSWQIRTIDAVSANSVMDEASKGVAAATVEHEIARLEDAISLAGMSQYLQVSRWGDDTIKVHGTIPAQFYDDWRAVQIGFDDGMAGYQLIASVQLAPRLEDLPSIAAVRLDKTPQIVFIGGARAGIGEVVANGWTVTAIQSGKINLERGPETFEIRF